MIIEDILPSFSGDRSREAFSTKQSLIHEEKKTQTENSQKQVRISFPHMPSNKEKFEMNHFNEKSLDY